MRFWMKCRKYAYLWGMAAAFICLAAGAIQGQFARIWEKAVMICMECIGIG